MNSLSLALVGPVESLENGENNPLSMSQIYQNARKLNISYEMTGFIAFVRGLFILVVEGQDGSVKKYYEDYKFEEISNEIEVLLYTEILNLHFPSSCLRLSYEPKEDDDFNKYVKVNIAWFNEISDINKKKLSLFYGEVSLVDEVSIFLSESAPSVEEVVLFSDIADNKTEGGNEAGEAGSRFRNHSLKLLAWPDFTQMRPEPSVVELCARLLASPCDYEQLISQSKFAVKSEIDSMLEKFDELFVLEYNQNLESESVSNNEKANMVSLSGSGTDDSGKSKRTFYKKMKKFLNFQKKTYEL